VSFQPDLSQKFRIRLKMIVAAGFISAAIACAARPAGRYSIAASTAYSASLFRQNCMICHGPEGEGKTLDDGRVIPNIRDGEHKYKTDQQIYDHIANGGNGMVPFRGILTDREIRMMVDLVQHDLRHER
jgi:mono/diheme cytochrome c family protein